jgi:hypothetical protein
LKLIFAPVITVERVKFTSSMDKGRSQPPALGKTITPTIISTEAGLSRTRSSPMRMGESPLLYSPLPPLVAQDKDPSGKLFIGGSHDASPSPSVISLVGTKRG